MGGYIGSRSVVLSTTAANVQDVTATDTTPEVTIINNTHEDTDGGREGKVIFKGQQSGGEETTLAEIQGSHDGTADDEKGDLIFKTNDGSDGASPTEALRIDSEQNLGLGTNSPDVRLHVTDSQEQLTLSEGGSKGATFDYRSSTGNLNIATNGIDARANPQMTLDLNGKVGIGTAAPARNLHLHESTSSTPVVFAMSTDGTGATTGDGFNISIDGSSGSVNLIQRENAAMQFYTNGGTNERMRIDSSGNFIVASNTLPLMGTDTGSGGAITSGGQLRAVADNDVAAYFKRLSSNGTAVEFYRSQINVGSISVTTSATAFNTSSDYRLKENVTDVTDGITRVKQLAPKRFNFIADADTTVDGFLAHEAQAVVPEAITGTKDEVDDNGDAVMQGIDQSKLVPLLTAALQEAIAKIETLETENTTQATQIADLITRVTALEAE